MCLNPQIFLPVQFITKTIVCHLKFKISDSEFKTMIVGDSVND